MSGFPEREAREIVTRALAEDIGPGGDITTAATASPGAAVRAVVVARERMVACGLPLARIVMDQLAPSAGGRVAVALRAAEGEPVAAGHALAVLEGPALAVLAGERVLLNLLGRLCGVATLTAQAVAEVAGTGCRISDTRKTTPGLRALEKHAVRAGGGESHRPTLDSMVLVKDNHKLLAGGLAEAIARLSRAGHDLPQVEVEVETLDEVNVALASGVGWILLDNMRLADIREAVRRCAGQARLEVSGGLRPGTLRPYAEAGVQRLSLGCLTHGARSMDVALDL
ncbi:MAG: carboxylating nicotinate-nucleotide diphosphorylase [Acidobacteria bacterium]|nr:carboxylating nicotinate-nucleotide diphosphorylase [Acidobacteriota bacterium]